MPEARDEQARDEEGARPATERAEELVDHLGGRLRFLAALAAFELRHAAARVREEAEDLWAEAQHRRHGER